MHVLRHYNVHRVESTSRYEVVTNPNPDASHNLSFPTCSYYHGELFAVLLQRGGRPALVRGHTQLPEHVEHCGHPPARGDSGAARQVHTAAAEGPARV